jgi:hypothetical protein
MLPPKKCSTKEEKVPLSAMISYGEERRLKEQGKMVNITNWTKE